MDSAQLALFEPTGPIVCELAMQQAKRGDQLEAISNLAKLRGWVIVERHYRQECNAARSEAECLAMLADLERLGGVV